MQKTVLRFGISGVVLMLTGMIVLFLSFRENPRWELQQVLAYITIILSLSFVHSGIKYWRDNYNSAHLSFKEGLKIGTFITLLPALAFGVFTWFRMSVLDPAFSAKYYAYRLAKIRESSTGTEFEQLLQRVELEKRLFATPFMQFAVMFVTVVLIGIVVTVISSLLLQRARSSIENGINK